MIEITNQQLFGKVIADALVAVDGNHNLQAWEKMRWLNAIAKAVAEIENHGAFMDWQEESQTLLIWSDKSNNIYEANGTCQCLAFEHGQPCWHKASKQLYKNYLAAEKAAQVPAKKQDISKAPYFSGGVSTNAKPVSVGNIRI